MEKKKLWMRLGVNLLISEEEESVIFGEDSDAGMTMLYDIVCRGDFVPNGDSYIPYESIKDFNYEYGTKYNPSEFEDMGFD